MKRANDLTDGVCLRDASGAHYLFYKEDAASIRMDLSGMAGEQSAVAVDAKKAYHDIEIGPLSTREQTWTAPYDSDWAIAVGMYSDRTRQ